jgi:hypothetical protein
MTLARCQVTLHAEPEAQETLPLQQAQQQARYFSKLIIMVIIDNPAANVKRKNQDFEERFSVH